MTQRGASKTHTRYLRLSHSDLHAIQRAFLAGDDLRRVVPWLPAKDKCTIAVETLDAMEVLRQSHRRLRDPDADFGPATDFKCVTIAERLLGAQRNLHETQTPRVRTLLEEAARSPTASPALEYEPLYRDLAEDALLRGDTIALEWLRRALAHNLSYHDGDDLAFELIDLASAYLQLDDLDLGLMILTKMLRLQPENIWIHRFMATGLGPLALRRLAREAAQRGLELIEVTGDPEDLADTFLLAQVTLHAAASQDRENQVSPEILRDLRQALAHQMPALHFDTPEQMCREIIPEFDQIPVKRPLRYVDLPVSIREAAEAARRAEQGPTT